ncbi:MAG: nuclease A inhibitor family protein [Pseudomonadota bacterium]|nr:nuclease A inhibitor family protein [Pseudomonadota bacterium]
MRTSAFLLLFLAACAADERAPRELGGASSSRVMEEGSRDAMGVLSLLNDPSTTLTILDIDAGLDRRAATNLIVHRDGADLRSGTRDDNPFGTIAEVDAVSYVGDSALASLLDYATAHGWVPAGEDYYGTVEGIGFTWDEAIATVALVNTATLDVLDVDVALDSRAAAAIVAQRPFVDVQALAAASYVGGSALDKLRVWSAAPALDGYGTPEAVAALTSASNGLWYTSESDYVLTVFTVGGAGDTAVTLANAKEKLGSVYVAHEGQETLAERAVQERTIAQVFDRYTVPEDWWEEYDHQQAAQWQALRAIFDEELSAVTVIRFGPTDGSGNLVGAIDVFVVGATTDGDLVGFWTVAVET